MGMGMGMMLDPITKSDKQIPSKTNRLTVEAEVKYRPGNW
jgi:hypothetical protein